MVDERFDYFYEGDRRMPPPVTRLPFPRDENALPRYHFATPGNERTLCNRSRTEFVGIRREDVDRLLICEVCQGVASRA